MTDNNRRAVSKAIDIVVVLVNRFKLGDEIVVEQVFFQLVKVAPQH